MKENNTIEEESLDALNLLANELRESNVRQYTCINDLGYSQLERNIVTILTTWQKEKDKVIIDKLTRSLEKLLSSHYKLTGGVIPTELEKSIEDILQSLNQ